MQILLRLYLQENIAPDEQLNKIFQKTNIKEFKITKKSIDARNKNRIIVEYQIILNKDDSNKLIKLNQEKIKEFNIQSIRKDDSKDNFIDINSNIYKIKDFNANDKMNQLNNSLKARPVIIGFGPSAIFATFAFLENNITPIVIEMGEKVEQRIETIEKYFKQKIFHPYSNINFGEGGAGTFSDGKLLTRSRDYLNQKVFSIFTHFGAPKEITYDANPHIGSDNLVKVISNIRNFFEEKSVKFYFDTKLQNIEENVEKNIGAKELGGKGKWRLTLINIKENKSFHLFSDIIILASGHSSKDIYRILYNLGTTLEPKPFAIGFRVEHPRDLIDKNQYGKFYKVLPSANYKLLFKGSVSTIFSFCMCPGGVVLPSNSDKDEIVTNGASKYLRDGINSNSAIVASISNAHVSQYINEIDKILPLKIKEFIDIKESIKFNVGLISENIVNINKTNDKVKLEIKNEYNENKIKCLDWEKNLIFQQIFEKLPFYLSCENFSAPFANISDLLDREDFDLRNTDSKPKIKTTYPFDLYQSNLLKLFSDQVQGDFLNAFKYFDKIIKGFIEKGIAIGYETRTSSPIKVIRKEDGQVLDGIYMIGEGSGYCGGITTSSVDGYKVASSIAKKLL